MSVAGAVMAMNMRCMLAETADHNVKLAEWKSLVGKSISKKNCGFFNTGSKTAVVRGMMNNEYIGMCFTIFGDDVLIPCDSVVKHV